MEYVLAGLRWDHCLVYLDDKIVFAKPFEDHLKKLKAVFSRLRAAGLMLKPSKCCFGRSSVPFLGHVVGTAGLLPEGEKVEAVKQFPRPRNAHAGSAPFLGFGRLL